MEERRRYKRLAVKMPVKWKIEGRAKRNLAQGLLLDTRNITTAGLFLKTPLRLKKGSKIDLELKLNNEPKPIELKAKVVWTAKKKEQPYLYPGIGIEFFDVPQKAYKILSTFTRNKLDNYRDAYELKNMYIKLKNMASRLVELEERHSTAIHFKKVIDNAITEIDDAAHLLDREISEINKM